MRRMLTVTLLLLSAVPLSGQRLVMTEKDALSGLQSRETDTRFKALAYAKRVGWRASAEFKSATIEAAWAYYRNELGPDPESYHGGNYLSAVIRTHDPAGIHLLIEHGLGTGGMVTNALADFGETALVPLLDFVQPDRERPSGTDWSGSVSSGLQALRFMVQDGTISAEMKPRVAAVAKGWLTGGPHDHFPVRAGMDIAIALGDADLVSLVERLTDRDAVATLIGPDTHQRWHDTIVEHAVSLLSGGDYWGPRHHVLWNAHLRGACDRGAGAQEETACAPYRDLRGWNSCRGDCASGGAGRGEVS